MSRHRSWIIPLLLLMVAPARAGVADHPLPVLNGQKSKHVFSATGVMQGEYVATSFVCGTLEKTKSVSWAVEAFTSSGAFAGRTQSFMLPGQLDTISLGGTTITEGLVPGLADSGAPL